MNKYTMYCTPEQTKKALKLGAPIKILLDTGNNIPVYVYTPTAIIDGKYGTFEYIIPTIEQMVGWLESKGLCVEAAKYSGNIYIPYTDSGEIGYNIADVSKDYNSRKEATIAAIDAALEYLSNKK